MGKKKIYIKKINFKNKICFVSFKKHHPNIPNKLSELFRTNWSHQSFRKRPITHHKSWEKESSRVHSQTSLIIINFLCSIHLFYFLFFLTHGQ